MQAGKSFQRLAWVAAISLIVSCGIGVAAIMGWIPTSLVKPEAPVVMKLEKRVESTNDGAIQPNA